MHSIIFRVDANAKIGTGHVMRMLSLAGECRENGWSTIFYGEFPESILEKIAKEGHGYFYPNNSGSPDPDEGLLSILESSSQPRWVALDGYQFDTAYQQAILTMKARLMVMDDYCHLNSYAADVLVNQNAGSECYDYTLQNNGVVLTGVKYALLRREFLEWRGWQRDFPEVATKLLITMGGTDIHGYLFKILEALNSCLDFKFDVCVLTGAANLRHAEVLACANSIKHHSIRVEQHSADMPSLMAWADLAVTAGGTTIWESAFMSLPSLLICQAENQRSGIDAASLSGSAEALDFAEGIKPNLLTRAIVRLAGDRDSRKEMGKAGQRLVDGLGAERIRKILEKMS